MGPLKEGPFVMSMNGVLRRFPGGEVARARWDEGYLGGLLAAGFGRGFGGSMPEAMAMLPWYVRRPLKLFMGKQLKAAGGPAGPVTVEPGAVLHLHKSWHGLHWLLCGSSWEGPEPLHSASVGGEEVGEDLGYGPARIVGPERVREVASAFAMLSAAQVLKRYDGEAMDAAEIYPGGFAEDRSWRGDMTRDFEKLKSFYAGAAKDGDAVLSWIE